MYGLTISKLQGKICEKCLKIIRSSVTDVKSVYPQLSSGDTMNRGMRWAMTCGVSNMDIYLNALKHLTKDMGISKF